MSLLSYYFNQFGPGAALAIIDKDKAVHVECCGLADIELAYEIMPDTRFDLASGSKLFTATAVMLLIERGDLALSAPVYEILTEFKPAFNGRSITVGDLLWHTSGLPDYLESGMYTPLEEMSSTFVKKKLPVWSEKACPGVSHNYSNTNYFVLSLLIEAVTGLSFAKFVEKLFFKPLGMNNTCVCEGTFNKKTIAKGYHNWGYGLPAYSCSEDLTLDTVGDGGVISSLTDLIRWQSAFWTGEIVTQKTLMRMATTGQLDSGEQFSYGTGLQIELSGDDKIWCGHGGSWTSSTVLIGYYKREKISVIILSNELMAPVERISQHVYHNHIKLKR